MEKIKHYFNRVGRDTLTGAYVYIWMYHLLILAGIVAGVGIVILFTVSFL